MWDKWVSFFYKYLFSITPTSPFCTFFLVMVLSSVRLFVTPWTLAHKVPLSMKFSRQEYWNGLLFPTPEDLLNPGIEFTVCCVSCIGRCILYNWATREFHILPSVQFSSVQFSSVAQSCLTLCDPMYFSMPGLPVHPNPCPLCQWCHWSISSSVIPFSSCPQSFPASGSFQMSQVAKILEFQLQHQSFQWTPRTDLL